MVEYGRMQNFKTNWLGTPQGMEARLVPAANIPFVSIHVRGLRGKSWLSYASAPWRITKAFLQARRELKRLQPALVVAFGGYVTGPVGLAAYTLKIPVVLHEQNAHMGMTNRWLQRIAAQVCLAFAHNTAKKTAIVTGNPIRTELAALPPKVEAPVSRPLQLLILGGSQGALAINAVVPAAIALLNTDEKPAIWHQAGKDKDSDTELLYQKYEISATVKAFIDDMAKAYQWADLVIARAGAMTVSELAAVGVPSILVPYPHAVDDHQTANAKYLTDLGAARLLPQTKTTP